MQIIAGLLAQRRLRLIVQASPVLQRKWRFLIYGFGIVDWGRLATLAKKRLDFLIGTLDGCRAGRVW